MVQQPLQVRTLLKPARASAKFFESIFNLPLQYISAFIVSIIGATTITFSAYSVLFGFELLRHVDIYSFTQFSWSMLVFWTISFLGARLLVSLIFPFAAHLIEYFSHHSIEDYVPLDLTYWDIIKFVAERFLNIKNAKDAFQIMGVIEKRVDGFAVVYSVSFLFFAFLFCGVLYGAILVASAAIVVVVVIAAVVSYVARTVAAESAPAAGEEATSFFGSFRNFPFKGVPTLIILLSVLTGATKAHSVMNQPATVIELSGGRSLSRVVVLNSEAGLFTYESASQSVWLVPWHRVSEMTVVRGK